MTVEKLNESKFYIGITEITFCGDISLKCYTVLGLTHPDEIWIYLVDDDYNGPVCDDVFEVSANDFEVWSDLANLCQIYKALGRINSSRRPLAMVDISKTIRLLRTKLGINPEDRVSLLEC